VAGRFMVGEWTVLPELNSLERDGRTVHLEPKVMQVLITLSEQPGEVVSKNQIFERVWPDTFVSDEVLTRSVSELRRAFQDNPQEPKYIQTIPKGGYRLVATVRQESAGSARRLFGYSWKVLTVTMITLLAMAASLYFVLKGRREVTLSSKITSLAVLPLTNLSSDPGQDYFADGMTDELTTRLSNISALRVISRTSVMHYKGTQKTMPEIARELNVDAVLEGSVLRAGDKVRISTQLILARLDKHLWAESYERDLRDVLALQSDVARAVAREISIQVTPQESKKLTATATLNPEAHDSYLKGLYYWNKFTEEGMRKAVDYFRDATQKQPNYAPAFAWLAHAYHELAYYVAPIEVMPKAKEAALRALELDNTDAEAHAALGWIKWHYDWDWSGSEQELMTALQSNPNSSVAHAQYAVYLDTMRRFDEALQEHKIALRLDPLSLVAETNLGDTYYGAQRYKEAEEQYKKTIELDGNFAYAHSMLAMVYVQQGRFEEGVQQIQKATQLDTDPIFAETLAYAYAASGNRAEARKVLTQMTDSSQKHYIDSVFVALVYLKMGEQDQACKWLEHAYQARDSSLPDINVEPAFAEFRSNPCVQTVMRRIRFPH
jgi:TolB-like protein/DNA-binding winged helix-turn-helix (wHTH) protein/Flp pilus assembly protein TadD